MSVHETVTLGYSIQGGLQADINKTITLGYGIGAFVAPLLKITLEGTIYRELLLAGTVTKKLEF